MSGDAFGPAGAPGADAEFTLNVDGQQIGGLQDVSASHAAGEEQTFTFLGNFAPGDHKVTITFANNDGTQGDRTDFGRGGDRNVYVDSVSYNGQTVSDTTTPIYQSPIFPPNSDTYIPGNAIFNVTDTSAVPADAPSTPTTTPAPVDVGTGADTLTLHMAEDPFQGDAQFTVAVDGQQVGGTMTTTAVAWEGQEQLFNLHGDWGSGAHTVTVNFLNDAAGSFDANGAAFDNVDRNLYVTGVDYDGMTSGGTPWELAETGSADFHIGAGGVPGTSVTSGTTSSGATSGTDATTKDNTTTTANTTTTENTGSTTGTGTETMAPAGSETTTTASGTGTSTNDTTGAAATTSDTTTVSTDALMAGDMSGTSSSGMTFMQPTGAATTPTTAAATGSDVASTVGTAGSGDAAPLSDGGTTASLSPSDWTSCVPAGSSSTDHWSGQSGSGASHGAWATDQSGSQGSAIATAWQPSNS
jgi:hypothetical protein